MSLRELRVFHHSPMAVRIAISLLLGPLLLFIAEPIACVLVPTSHPLTGKMNSVGFWKSVDYGLLRAFLSFVDLLPALGAAMIAACSQVIAIRFFRSSWFWFVFIAIVLESIATPFLSGDSVAGLGAKVLC
jgi:hypothetical protein